MYLIKLNTYVMQPNIKLHKWVVRYVGDADSFFFMVGVILVVEINHINFGNM